VKSLEEARRQLLVDRVMYIQYYLNMRIPGQVSEKRTQIYLPNDMYQEVKKLAARRGVSMARIIREALEEKIPQKGAKRKRNKEWENLFKLAGIVKEGPSDMSKNIGKYIGQMYRAKG
jgi:hypothetical protein